MAATLLGYLWMVCAPVVAGPVQAAQVVPLSCPSLILRHAVGSDLRTAVRAADLCVDGPVIFSVR